MATDTSLGARVLKVAKLHLQESEDSPTFTGDDLLHAAGTAAQACLYAALFCPKLVEVDGSVLLHRVAETEDDFTQFRLLKDAKGKRAAEASFNFVEVPYLFLPAGRDLSDEEDEILAEMIAASWRGWLGHLYPGRQFAVEVLSPEVTGSVVGIQFSERESVSK